MKTCGSESELEHQKYAKSALQLAFLIKIGINGFDIYKNVGVKHAVVLLSGLWTLNVHKSRAKIKIPKGSRSEKMAIGTAISAIRANKMTTNALFEAVWGAEK